MISIPDMFYFISAEAIVEKKQRSRSLFDNSQMNEHK